MYPLLKDCWTCSVFESMYDAFSIISFQTFEYFQSEIFKVLSVCLALWVVYKTYLAFQPTLDAMLYPDAPKFNADYIKDIYKKIFLTVAVVGLFIVNNPRNIFANTFEITLDFGSGVGREFIRKKIIQKDKIPSSCQNMPTTLVYKEGHVLSENTKNNMVCLMREVNVLRYDYMDLGISMFEYGLKPMIATAVEYIAIRGAFFIGGSFAKNFGSKKWFKKMGKKRDKLNDMLSNSTSKEQEKKIRERLRDVENRMADELSDIKSGGKKTRRINKVGEVLQDNNSIPATMAVIANIFASEDVRMGLAGVCLVIGLFFINMFFSFIIVEYMLFLGVAIILMPVLAVCYIFETTRRYATVSISNTFSFALRLIFTCIAMVMCAEVNDWILGGMFSASGTNITTPQTLIGLLKAGNIEEFNRLVGTTWYFVYVIIAVGLDGAIMMQSGKFAGWFGASVSDSSLVQPLKSMGLSTLSLTKSVIREVKDYRKSGETKLQDRGSKLDYLLKRLSGKNKNNTGDENT